MVHLVLDTLMQGLADLYLQPWTYWQYKGYVICDVVIFKDYYVTCWYRARGLSRVTNVVMGRGACDDQMHIAN